MSVKTNKNHRFSEVKLVKKIFRSPVVKSTTSKPVSKFEEVIKIRQENRVNLPNNYAEVMKRTGSGTKCTKKPIFHTPILPPISPSFKEILSDLFNRFPELLSSFIRGKNSHPFLTKKRITFAVVFLMSISFISGMVSVLSENKSEAQNTFIELDSNQNGSLKDAEDLDNFAKSTIKLLETNTKPIAGPDDTAERKARLKKYLKDRNSPFYEDDQALDSLLSLPHMKLILAISYAESTMGRNCYYNNCSGIGGYVPNLRKYKEFRNWMIDLNDLLERRYKNWTLEEMCGVYVQPCNPNWLKATRQVLNELKERQIE